MKRGLKGKSTGDILHLLAVMAGGLSQGDFYGLGKFGTNMDLSGNVFHPHTEGCLSSLEFTRCSRFWVIQARVRKGKILSKRGLLYAFLLY